MVGRSPTSTVSSGSGTGVVTIGTISGSGGRKATLRPSPSGGVVDRVSRAAVTEHVVLTGCLFSIPAIYSFSNDDVWELSLLPIRLPQANELVPAYTVQAQAFQVIPTGQDTIFVRNENFVSRCSRCSPRATDKPMWQQILANITVLVPNLHAVAIAKMASEYAYWPLTTAEVRILRYYSCWHQIPAAVPESSFLPTMTLEKYSQFKLYVDNHFRRHKFHSWSRESRRNVDNPLHATIMRESRNSRVSTFHRYHWFGVKLFPVGCAQDSRRVPQKREKCCFLDLSLPTLQNSGIFHDSTRPHLHLHSDGLPPKSRRSVISI